LYWWRPRSSSLIIKIKANKQIFILKEKTMVVTFTLQNQYSGATYVAGPFNISGTTSGNVTTELATGITKAQLLTGHTISGVSDLTTGGTIASTGVCTTTQEWQAYPSATPTPTSTSSTTTPPLYGFFHSNPAVSPLGHCDQNQITSALFYSSSTTISNMLGTTVYDNAQDPWVGGDFYYAVSSDNTFNTNDQPYYVIQVDNFGLVTDVQYIADCAGGGAQV
jgi:hypothetical protein